MTPSERYWLRVSRYANTLRPEMVAVYLRALEILRESLSPAQLAQLIQSGDVEGAIRLAFSEDVMGRAMLPVREEIRRVTEKGFNYVRPSVPGGIVNRQIGIAFDYLAPQVVTAIRTLESRALTALRDDARETVRAFVENGIRDGRSPLSVAREIKSVIGLGPTQLKEVENYRAALEGRDGRDPFDYARRDKRYDKKIKQLQAAGEKLTQPEIDKMVEAYKNRRISLNAEANARTAMLDSFKRGQMLAWEEARNKGYISGPLLKQWIGVNDERERPEHVRMNNQIVPFDSPFSNGELVPGESTYNCRCLPRVFVGKLTQSQPVAA